MLIHSLSWFSKKGPVLWILFLFCSLCLYFLLQFLHRYTQLQYKNDSPFPFQWLYLHTVLGETVYCATSIHDNIRSAQVIYCWIPCVTLDWGKYFIYWLILNDVSHEVWRWKQLWPNWKYNFDILSRSRIPFMNKMQMHS
jgi:hypothetical protein